MTNGQYTPSELLEILRKVWPEAYGHVVWMIRSCLRIRADMPQEKTKGCSGELLTPAATKTRKENTP
jgi:hypothetical protein